MFSTLSRNVVSVASLCWVGFVVAACLAAPALAGNELTALYTPSPAAPPANGWHDCVSRCGPSVMLVGTPGQSKATAFVISAKNRLLATNAHVADDFCEKGAMTACANGTGMRYTVDRVWYHPGVVRTHDQSLSLRCQDPSHGEVLFGCTDLAVLHLAEGADLPPELTLATREELNDLFAQPVAMLGFPGCDQRTWPVVDEKPQASFREGTVNRLNPLKETGNRDSRDLRMVEHSIFSWFGASGAPIFLPNGHVVAINFGIKGSAGLPQQLAFGIRADCLWELLAYHNLTGQVSIPVDPASIDLARYREPDVYETNCHTAMSLVAQCNRMMLKGEFMAARENCNQALLLAPSYAKALRMRGNVMREYVGAQGANLPADRKLEMLAKAYQDIQQYREAVPGDPWGTIDSCWTAVWLDCVRTGNSFNPQTIAVLTKLMENLRDPQQRAAALFVRAAAANYRPEAQPDLDEAVRLVPCGFTGAAAYNTRGMFWQQRGRSTEASADFHRASELLDAERLAVKAEETLERTFVSEDELRRAAEGLAEACKLTGYTRWQHAYLMAFLQHRLGDDGTATAWATTALSLAPDDRKTRIRTDLAAYGDAAGRKRQTTCKVVMPQPVPTHTTFHTIGSDVPNLEPIDPREPSIDTVRDVLR